MQFSAIVPTYNPGKDLDDLLKRLVSQRLDSPLEIVVIDSGSTDGARETATSYGAKVLEIDTDSFNHGATRNQAIEASNGELIFLFTQDALPASEEYCRRLSLSVINEKADGGFARQVARPEAPPLVRRDVSQWLAGSCERRVCEIESMSAFCQSSPIDRYLSCVFDNVASLVRRETWKTIPFPEAPYGEDLEWCFRVLSNGGRIVYEPEAEVIHSHERPPSYLYKRTLIDHYRLYELFGVRTVPSRARAMAGIVKKTLADWAWLAAHPSFETKWFTDLAMTPRYAWAGSWGQYEGARRAASGQPMSAPKGV